VGEALRSVIRPVGYFEFGDVQWTVLTVVSAAMAGAVVGGAQWFVLRRHVYRAGWWVLASAVGWAAGQAAYLALMGVVLAWDKLPIIYSIVGGMFSTAMRAVLGGVGGAITGIPLVWLLQQSVERRFE
jgi:hypothetical protein